MKRLVMLLIIVALAACRGERPPRDYQNAPPAMTHPPQTKSETPSEHGMGQAPPQPTTGVSGTAAPTQPISPTSDTATTTIADTPPATTTT